MQSGSLRSITMSGMKAWIPSTTTISHTDLGTTQTDAGRLGTASGFEHWISAGAVCCRCRVSEKYACTCRVWLHVLHLQGVAACVAERSYMYCYMLGRVRLSIGFKSYVMTTLGNSWWRHRLNAAQFYLLQYV